jgi:hypothetical protein
MSPERTRKGKKMKTADKEREPTTKALSTPAYGGYT